MGLESSSSRAGDPGPGRGSLCVRVSLLQCRPGAVPWLCGLDSGLDPGAAAAVTASGAVETLLPDNALTLPKEAATHSAQRPVVPRFSCLAAPSAALRCLAKPPKHLSFYSVRVSG